MERAEGLTRVAGAASGHLGTVRPDGAPHVVVVTFAVIAGDIVTAVDDKPKSTPRLQRLVNIESNPAVSFLVDHYEDDWSKLWWVRVDGRALIHHAGPAWSEAIDALVAKYRQYRDRPPRGPVVRLSVDGVTAWSSTP